MDILSLDLHHGYLTRIAGHGTSSIAVIRDHDRLYLVKYGQQIRISLNGSQPDWTCRSCSSEQ
jgi:hypothetical protein